MIKTPPPDTEELVSTHLRQLEALLFTSASPLTEKALEAFFPSGTALRPLLEELACHYKARGVELVQRGDSWAFRTAPDLTDKLTALRQKEKKLSRAALETLAIIAYHQPVTRAEIDAIRGVSSGRTVFDTLLEAGWIAPGARKDVPGRPISWKTTDHFLDSFGLESCKDLPGLKELTETGLLTPQIQQIDMQEKTEETEDENASANPE